MTTNIVIAIVGASGSGKTLASMVLADFGVPALVSCTTRPIRNGEKNGVDHYFVTEDAMPPNSEMAAYTKYGNYHYWTEKRQIFEHPICSYVIDEAGIIYLKKVLECDTNVTIVPVLIKRSIELRKDTVPMERIKRDEERECLPESEYIYVIENNGSKQDLSNSLKDIARNIKLLSYNSII